MPIPQPHTDESRDAFMARCHSALADEYPDADQRHAICMSQLDKAMQFADLLKSVRGRAATEGILTADRYFRSIQNCFNGGFCPTKLFSKASQEQWIAALKAAESRLTFSHADLKIAADRIEKDVNERPNLLLAFECTITTPRRDRDRDVLLTEGFELDLNAPLLWQHVDLQPLGPQLGSVKSKDRLRGRFGISDTELGHDAAVLIEDGALRISHGFIPLEFEPLEDDGWLIKSGEIYEVSLVSVPSNLDAVIENFVRHRLRNAGVRAWARTLHDNRPAQGIGIEFPVEKQQTPAENPPEQKQADVCACQKGTKESDEQGQCPDCGYRAPLSAFCSSDMGMEDDSASFEALRKRLVELSFKQELPVIKHAYLSLMDAYEVRLALKDRADLEERNQDISRFLEVM